MAVPIFEDFLYPFLSFVGQRDMTTKEIKRALIEHFHLTEQDCALPTRSGTTTQLNDRINWTRQYLRRAQMLEIPSKGVYRISERGRNYLATHTDLRKKDLLQFPEFAVYANGGINDSQSRLPMASVAQTEHEITPTDQLEEAYSAIVRDLTSELLQKIIEQTPEFFEHLVVDLLEKMGYGTTSFVTQYSRDGGIDGIIYEDKLGLGQINVQAKRYAPGRTVTADEVRSFSGALDQHTTKGVFVTTSDYSKDAKAYVKSLRNKSIVLINGEELAQYMIEYNVGVSIKKSYTVKRIDNDYFEE